jgi:hypothetical protein
MMKKELFVTAEMEVIEFEHDDVILTSRGDEYEGEMTNGYIHPSLF